MQTPEVERGWSGITTIEQEGLLDAFIEAVALDHVEGEAALRLSEIIGYRLDEDGAVSHTARSCVAHAAATMTLAETLEPFVFKVPFSDTEGVLLELYRAPFYTLRQIESAFPVAAEIAESFYRVLPVIDGGYCISEAQMLNLCGHYARTEDTALSLHDFAFKAEGAGLSFHYDKGFFNRYLLDPERDIHRMLYALAAEQRISTTEFATLYGASNGN